MKEIKIFFKSIYMLLCVVVDLLTVCRMSYMEHPFWDIRRGIWHNCYDIARSEVEYE